MYISIHYVITSIIICFFLFIAPLSHAERWKIEADKLTFYQGSKVALGEGDVLIKGKNISINGRRIALNTKTGDARAYGEVFIVMGEDILYGSEAQFNIKKGIGEIRDAKLFIKKNQLHIEAKELRRLGVQEYEADRAIISTCSPDSRAWSFRCKRLRVESDGMVTAWDSTFNISKLPIIYTPWLKAPLNKYKKSGFLIPTISTSKRNGFDINIPYYLVINDSIDMTFYQNPMITRGWMQGIELRYVMSEASKGIVRYNFLIDTKEDNDFNHDGLSRKNEKRWWLRAKADQKLPFGFNGNVDLDLISDMDYLQEFDYGPMGYLKTENTFMKFFKRFLADDTDPIRSSYAQAMREGTDDFWGIEARYNDNRAPGEQDKTIHTIPLIQTKGLQRPIWKLWDSGSPIYLSYDASYVNYWRERGLKEERLFASPMLHIPVAAMPYMDITTNMSVEDRLYRIEGGAYTTTNDLSSRFNIDISSTLERGFGAEDNIMHTIRPRFIYSYRPDSSKRYSPIIDEYDAFSRENQITFELLSFLTQKLYGMDNEHSYHDIMRFKLSQTYAMEDEGFYNGRKFSDLYGEVEFYLGGSFLRYDTTYNLYGDGFTSYNLWTSGGIWKFSSYDLSYRYNKIMNLNELNVNLSGKISERLTGTYGLRKSFEQQQDFSTEYGLHYISGCWALNMAMLKDRGETRLTFTIELLGLGSWSLQ